MQVHNQLNYKAQSTLSPALVLSYTLHDIHPCTCGNNSVLFFCTCSQELHQTTLDHVITNDASCDQQESTVVT